jgi:hypothetical protein
MVQLSSMEHRLEMAKKSDDMSPSTFNATNTDPNDLDLVMQHRIRLAKLEDTYYDDSYDDEGEDDGSDDILIDRRKRFRRAYEVALATDAQGYQVVATREGPTVADRTPQELTALSWAAFCTELLPEVDAAIRIQALDCDNVFERLKLASVLMRRKKALLRARMEKAGLRIGSDEEFDEETGLAKEE